MNIQKITNLLINAGIEENEAKTEVKMLLEHFCQYTEIDRLKGIELDSEKISLVHEKVLERIENRKPIQHIIGKAWFMGEYFKVTPDVLIPRDETELVVSKAIDIIKENNLKNILDIGTGSGCIACTIAKRTKAVVLGIDISSDALRIALDNVTALGINNRAVFRKSDLYSKIRKEEKFDMIISNPPYIPYGTQLSPEVMHEPKEALFADENGLKIYREIIESAPQFLNSNGWIIFELGINEAHAVENFLAKDFKNITILKDFAGIDRIIYAQCKY